MEITFLTRLEKTNVNSSGTEGNILTLKKTEEIDGTQRIFISATSIKYAIKEYWKNLGINLSPLISKTETSQITTECDPQKYIDDDLFGYLDTKKDKKRVAPVKTNGMISLFPYRGDLDRGVRFDPSGKNHSMFDTEIMTNIFRSNWAIELDEIGEYDLKEKDKIKHISLDNKTKEKRIKLLLRAIFNLWSRVKQTNYLSKMYPEVMIIVFRDDKALTIADKLRIDQEYNLDIDALKEAIDYNKDSIKEIYIGAFKTFLKNWKDVKTELAPFLKSLNISHEILELPELKSKFLSDDFKIY